MDSTYGHVVTIQFHVTLSASYITPEEKKTSSVQNIYASPTQCKHTQYSLPFSIRCIQSFVVHVETQFLASL